VDQFADAPPVAVDALEQDAYGNADAFTRSETAISTRTDEIPMLGRAQELEILVEAFNDARNARGGLHVVLGAPGVGKTRLAAALAEHATEQEARVLWTRGWGRAAPTYWPWVELARGLCQDVGPTELRRLLGSRANELLPLMPELAERLWGQDSPEEATAEHSETAGRETFDALVSLFRARSNDVPFVVVLDDLDAIDVDSLEALDHVSRSLKDSAVLFVATMRERAREHSPLARTHRTGFFEHIPDCAARAVAR
jgi:predicted ATPase